MTERVPAWVRYIGYGMGKPMSWDKAWVRYIGYGMGKPMSWDEARRILNLYRKGLGERNEYAQTDVSPEKDVG